MDAALKELVNAVDKSAQQGPLPWIGGRLPADDLMPRSDHYILGPVALNRFFPLGEDDWLGFRMARKPKRRSIKLGGKTVTLLLADFPTPQIASDELSRLERRFNVNGSKSGAGGTAVRQAHGNHARNRDGSIHASRSGSLARPDRVRDAGNLERAYLPIQRTQHRNDDRRQHHRNRDHLRVHTDRRLWPSAAFGWW